MVRKEAKRNKMQWILNSFFLHMTNLQVMMDACRIFFRLCHGVIYIFRRTIRFKIYVSTTQRTSEYYKILAKQAILRDYFNHS